MMKIILCLTITFFMHCSCIASQDDWRWSFDAGYDFQNSGTLGAFGVTPSSVDGYDLTDIMLTQGPRVYLGTYHENGVGGWTGVTGFYRRDFYASFPVEQGQSKSWTIYVWADPTLGAGGANMNFAWTTSGVIMPHWLVDVKLKLVSRPSGITGGPAVGTTYDLSSYPPGQAIALPVFRTDNGLEGYKFELTAAVVPEPSSLMALVGGLAGFGGFVLRRRR